MEEEHAVPVRPCHDSCSGGFGTGSPTRSSPTPVLPTKGLGVLFRLLRFRLGTGGMPPHYIQKISSMLNPRPFT